MNRENNPLSERQFVPFEDGASKLNTEDIQKLNEQLKSGWDVTKEHHLEKEYDFPDFRHALDFTNKVGELAEELNHHPEIYLSWGKVKIIIWTHKAGGLTEGDFIFAAKADDLI